ncbi:family 16 glycoside hydrolase [uncultured Chitinophaga sp.]|uniref:family 16 glycoside hydrolase n=1 Tax=uncultured Chitinophaga sp. TaxID=339340 RepID=UPI0025CF1B43|nr:family 16 glycoside hydrolase [uncultured Chitinophaga sp.]
MKQLLFALSLLISLPAFAQTDYASSQTAGAVNRKLTQSGGVIEVDEQPGVGVVWFGDKTFSEGTIEFDVKGKDVLQKSFVGVAFHGQNDTTYDAVYFRPFNFKATDAVRKSHSVQYISNPKHDWPVLRQQFPNKYEQAVEPAPDPNDWFHVRIEVKGKAISVFVNNSTIPSLIVNKLNDRKSGKIGMWVGHGSGASWRKIFITERPVAAFAAL